LPAWGRLIRAIAASAFSQVLLEHDEREVVAQRRAEARAAVGDRLDLAGGAVAAAQVPGDQRVAHVDDAHAHARGAALARPGLGGGEQRAARPAVLALGIDAQRTEGPR